MALVKFFRGLKKNYVHGTTHKDAIYFATDTHELLIDNVAYGLSADDSDKLVKLNGAVDSIDWVIDKNTVYIKATNIGGEEEKYTSIPLATADHAGLMSMAHFSGLTTLLGTGEGSVSGQVAAAKTELIGQNTDTAASNTIEGAKKHATTLNTAMDTRVKTLEGAIGEGGSVETQITGAINKLDVAAIGGTGKVITTVSETDGKIAATAIDLNAEAVAATATVADNAHVAVTGTTVKDQIASLAASIKTVTVNANSYSIKKLTTEEVTALGEANVREAYEVIDKNGDKSGETIKIYKDSSLKEVKLDGQNLNFTYILANGSEQTVPVDISAFLAESEFGDGLEVVNHIAKVKKDKTSEAFLTVGADGVKLSGVQKAIDDAKSALLGGATEDYTLRKLDDKITAVDNKVSGALTVVNAKTDGHVTVAVTKSEDGNHNVVTVSENDIASASDLTNEIAHRKAVTGINGNAYVAHTTDTIIGEATSLDDADVKLAAKLKAVNDSVAAISADKAYVKQVTVNGVDATVADNKASVTIDGADIKLDGYTISSAGGALAATDTVNSALGKIEYMLSWHEA